MRIVKKRSIKYKLLLISLITMGFSLLLSGVILITNEFFSMRRSLINDLLIQAKIIGDNSTAALLFDDQKAANEILSALRASPFITGAVIYKDDGEVFAIYRGQHIKERFSFPSHFKEKEYYIGVNHLVVFQSIIFEKKLIGTIYICSNLKNLYAFLGWYAGVVAIVLVVSLCFAFLMLSKLQKTITKPILLLSEATRKVSDGNFSIRVRIESEDELGDLAGAFNKMIEDLHKTTVTKDYVNNIIRSMTDTLVVVNPDSTVEMVNPSILKLLGYREDELLNKPFNKIMVCDEGGMVDISGEYEHSLKNVEKSYLAKSGKRIPVLFSSAIMRNDKGEILGIVYVAQDITEQKKLEEERQKMQMKMIATSKLASLGEIATGIAHEINQPLTYIGSFIQRLQINIQENTVDRKELKEELKTSYTQVNRIVNIIDHLRTFGRRDNVEMQEISIETVFQNTLLLLGERVRMRNIKMVQNIEQNLPTIFGNLIQLEQVFINLFQNAIDAFTKQSKEAEIYVNMKQSENRESVIIKVRDNGIGMEDEVRNKIFEPFFTTKEVGKGTGLGLSIVYGIIQEHNGTITCDSKIEKGTTFTIELPIK